jgi:V8-like Glu-specific endopeptidase
MNRVIKVNLNDMGTQLLFTTLPIWVEKYDGNTSVGTAFFYMKPMENGQSIPFLVTNEHVVRNSRKGFIALMKRNGDYPNPSDKVTVEINGERLCKFLDSDNDLAIIPMGPILNELKDKGIEIFFRSITPDLIPKDSVVSELSAIEDVTFIGYPSGISDRKNNTPIVRKGMTATPLWNDYEGKPIFLIDAGVFPGSSGSPVLILNRGSYTTKDGIAIGNRLLFVGIITSTMFRTESADNRVYLGLGQVVKSNILKGFVDNITQMIK